MGLGDFISGIFGSKNNATADAYQVDPNAYQYGGQAGGAAAASNAALAQQGVQGGRMGAADAMAGGLTGMSQDTYNVGQVGTGYATNALDQSQGARDAQAQALGMMQQRAQGQNLISNQVAAAQSQQLAAQQASAAAGARGPAALALAQQNAAGNTSTGQAAIAQGAGINAANEQLANEQAFGGMASNIRQGDLSTAGAGTSLAQTGYGASNNYAGNAVGAMNAGTGAAQVGLGYGQLANEINTTQLAAQQNEQGQKSSNQAGAQALNAQIQGQNASTNLSLGMGVVGGLASLAGAGAGAAGMGSAGGASAGAASAAGGAAAKGGAIGGKPYLVGEEGPELVVPKKPGYVMTAHQTAALLGGGPPTDQQQSYLSKAWHESRAMGGMMMPQQVRTQPNAPAWGFQGMPAAGQATAQTAPVQTGSLGGGGGGGASPGPMMARPPMRADGGDVDPSPIMPSTWGTGGGTPVAPQAGLLAPSTYQESPDLQQNRDLAAGQGMMTGLAMAGAYGAPGLNQAQGLGGVYAGLKQAGVDTKPSPEGKKSDQAQQAQDKANGKDAKPAWWQQGLGDNAKGWSGQAAHVDTSFHGGAGYVPPNLIPLRALGGPMGGANLGSNLGSGLGSSMGQGVNPYSGGQAQISQWANWNMKHPGALDNRADGGPMTSYEEELNKRCSGGLMAAYGKGGK